MIKSALVNRYRIREFIQFMSNILMIVRQHGPDTMKIKGPYLALRQHHEKLGDTGKQTPDSPITPQLAQLDEQRDQAVICLRQVSEGYSHHHAEKRKAAAETVLAGIDKHGNRLYSLNYGAETAALKDLVRDLQTVPKYADAIKELGLEDVVLEMKNTNLKFEALFVQRLEEYSQCEPTSSQVVIRQTIEAYKTLVQYVEAHATLTPSEAYTSLINHINENIEHFNQLVERRKGTNEAGQANADAAEGDLAEGDTNEATADEVTAV